MAAHQGALCLTIRAEHEVELNKLQRKLEELAMAEAGREGL